MAEKHTTVRNGKRLLWHTDRLWQAAENLPPFAIEIASIRELAQNCWFGAQPPTIREVLEHVERIRDTNLEYPIILNEDGSLMDGGHRLCKAILAGHTTIMAVQFPTMPDPDEVQDLT